MKDVSKTVVTETSEKKAKRAFEFPKVEEFGKGKRASCFSSLT